MGWLEALIPPSLSSFLLSRCQTDLLSGLNSGLVGEFCGSKRRKRAYGSCQGKRGISTTTGYFYLLLPGKKPQRNKNFLDTIWLNLKYLSTFITHLCAWRMQEMKNELRCMNNTNAIQSMSFNPGWYSMSGVVETLCIQVVRRFVLVRYLKNEWVFQCL